MENLHPHPTKTDVGNFNTSTCLECDIKVIRWVAAIKFMNDNELRGYGVDMNLLAFNVNVVGRHFHVKGSALRALPLWFSLAGWFLNLNRFFTAQTWSYFENRRLGRR